MRTNGPTPPEQLSEPLIETLDELTASELRTVRTYVEHRLEEVRTPIAEQIRAEATGEVLDIEDCGTHTLVRMCSPTSKTASADTSILLYSVRREKRLDGSKALHWSWLGEVQHPPTVKCENCATLLTDPVQRCNQCGSDRLKPTFQESHND